MLTIKLYSFEEFASENLGFGTLAGAGTVQVEILLVYSLFLLISEGCNSLYLLCIFLCLNTKLSINFGNFGNHSPMNGGK